MSGFGIIPRDPIEAGVLAEFTGADAKVLLAVCSHVRGKDWTARPGVKRIATLTGLCVRTVQLSMRRLETLGVYDAEVGRGRGHKTIFRLRGKGEHPFTLSPREKAKAHAGKGERPRQEKANAHAPVQREQQQLEQHQNQQGAAEAPRAPHAEAFSLTGVAEDKKATANGAGPLVAQWVVAFKERTGNGMAETAKGRLAGTLKNLLATFPAEDLAAAISRWFAEDRQTYSIGLFKTKLEDGDADITGRAVRGKRGTFTPAAQAEGVDYSLLETTFEEVPRG